MPVRSLNSSVLKWPDRATVLEALGEWARRVANTRPQVTRIGCIGSYARDDWGVGSDLDIVVVVQSSDSAFRERGRSWDATTLPVPADVLVYTEDEIAELKMDRTRLARVLEDEAIWVYDDV